MRITWGLEAAQADDDLTSLVTCHLRDVFGRLGVSYQDAQVDVFDLLSDHASERRPEVLVRVTIRGERPSVTASAVCEDLNELAQFEAAWTWGELGAAEPEIVWLSAEGLSALA